MTRNSFFYYFGLIMQLGLTIIVTILVGLAIGIGLDRAFNLKGIFTITFLIIGILAGFMNAYRDITKKK